MKFYLIPGTDHAPAQLAATQAEGASICKERALKFDPVAMAHDVPTDPKAALQAYVNDLLAKAHGQPLHNGGLVTEARPYHVGENGPEHIELDGCTTREQAERLARHAREQELQAPQPAAIDPRQPTLSPQAIEEWVLDHATVAQAEQLFARLGTRFAELVKGAR